MYILIVYDIVAATLLLTKALIYGPFKNGLVIVPLK
jgi:hypothetical protein